MNINRDYLIINDVKKSNIKLDNGSMFFYITDKNTQNIFVNLVINISNNDLIQKFANIENAEDYTLTMNIVKPSNTYKVIEGKLHDKEKAIFEFNLNEDCCDEIGTYRCELLTKCNINNHEEITTSNKLTYKVKSSVLNDLDDIVEAPEYPLVIQLFDKLSDIEQYEEDRRANELARQLAEEQRQAKHDELVSDMTNSIQVMDDKVIDVENRIATKEQAVDKLIVDTKTDINDYKVAKDQEIDNYKALKDTEINNAIANQDTKIDTAISEQNDRIALVENNDAVQDNRLNTVEAKNQQQDDRLDVIEAKNTQQDSRLDIVENKNTQQDNRLNVVEAKNVEQDNRLNDIEAIDVAQNTRLDAIEIKNQEQDDRLLDIEKVNKRQDMNLKCLFAESKNNMIDITEEGNSIYLQNSTIGYTLIDEIKGNTLVNCNKEPDKELILNGNINTSGDNNITLTEGVDGGLVDVALEGNTLVNVSKTKDSTAITKAYTVENSGNHIALQGDVDGSCRPVITGNTLVNGVIRAGDIEVSTSSDTGEIYGTMSTVKPNTTYTISYFIKASNSFTVSSVARLGMLRVDEIFSDNTQNSTHCFIGDLTTEYQQVVTTFTTSNVTDKTLNGLIVRLRNAYTDSAFGLESNTLTVKDVIILEGDYTNKPIPDYFEGSQSTFEDNLVTQEMVDNGEEVADNLGKYRVDYKSTREDGTVGSTKTIYLNSPLLEGDTIEEKDDGIYHVHRYNKLVLDGSENWSYEVKEFYCKRTDHKHMGSIMSDKIPYGETNFSAAPDNHYHIKLGASYGIIIRNDDISSVSDFKNWLQQNPVAVVYELSTPTYELIEQSNLVIPSYANGHLDFDTAVPVEKVDFLPFNEELTYLYANTQYTVQFVSDKAIAVDITLGGTQLLAQSIIAGLNRIAITTPATLVDNKLIIDGVGANISKVVVTNTDREFSYFEGMKSVGECEELEVNSHTQNLWDWTKSQDIEIINAIKNSSTYNELEFTLNNDMSFNVNGTATAGFQFVNIINLNLLEEGSVYDVPYSMDIIIEIKKKDGSLSYVGEFTYTKDIIQVKVAVGFSSTKTYNNLLIKPILRKLNNGETRGDLSNDIFKLHKINTQQLTHEPLRGVGDTKDRYVLIDGKWYIERKCGVRAYQEGDKDNCKTDLVNTVYPLETPTYEPINYNPLEVYSDTTRITTNSTIPTNITVKNHGFNCLLKPSTTYTISSNLGLNTVTTPSALTEDCLRFMDTDTSDITTMKNVLVLEGDWSSKTDLIPSNFSGIESAFEQEYDAEKGKYKVNVKVANEDKSKENNITFYIEEPLRGTGDAKDRVFIQDDKVVVERNCGIFTFDGSDDEDVYPIYGSIYNNKCLYGAKIPKLGVQGENLKSNALNTSNGATEYYDEGVYLFNDSVRFILNANRLNNIYTDSSFKQWLQQNPTTVVYQLAEPTYEEVEYNDTKLFIESFKNSTLFYNSNVPVTSKLYYSYSVPIVDTVAQTASISDEQDNMIIDLATQVAVMEMMLM